MSTATQRGLLSREQAAEYLSLSLRSFCRLVASESIPRRRIGCMIRFSVRDLDTYIASLPNAPAPRPGKRGTE
jgi:excisionase family DNA binding protein